MPTVIDHFDALTARGLKIIPLRENSKIPMCKAWSIAWEKEAARERLLRFPEANIGLLLGEIVDVEGDSEQANETITDLIGDYPHPCYHSLKSIHHLFINPDPYLRHFRWEEIEFRGHGHQSVLPPSQHAGVIYRWLKQFRFPVPPMPERLLSFLNAKRRKKTLYLKKDHLQVWCGVCKKKCYLHEKRFALELKAFQLLGAKWECHDCRTIDLRPACRLLRSGIEAVDQLSDQFS